MRKHFRLHPAALLVLLTLIFTGAADAQKKNKKSGKAVQESGTLWRNVNVRAQDLFYGPGGKAGAPDLDKITFIREEKGGYSTKYRIRDGSNRVWVAKIGKE